MGGSTYASDDMAWLFGRDAPRRAPGQILDVCDLPHSPFGSIVQFRPRPRKTISGLPVPIKCGVCSIISEASDLQVNRMFSILL